MRSFHSGSPFVTAAAYLPLSQKLAVSSFSKAVKIFDVTNCEPVGLIPEIDYAPLSMGGWVTASKKEILAVGDAGGFVRLLDITVNPLVRE